MSSTSTTPPLQPIKDVPNELFSAFAFLGFLIATLPLPLHIKSASIGTSLFGCWVSFSCLMFFINSVMWNKDAVDRAPLWCDITAKFIIATGVGLPAALLVMNRRLYYVATQKAVNATAAEKKRAILIDLLIGLGIPLIEMAVSVVVQGHRYNIFEQVGCYPATYNVTLAYPLVFAWAPAIGLVSAYYGISALVCWRRHHQQLKSCFPKGRFGHSFHFRLALLSAIEVLFSLPLGCWEVVANATINGPVRPWISWEDTHSNFNRADQFPAVLWKLKVSMVTSFEVTRWSSVLCAVLFFAFFGLAEEARASYREVFDAVRLFSGRLRALRGGHTPTIGGDEISTAPSVFEDKYHFKRYNKTANAVHALSLNRPDIPSVVTPFSGVPPPPVVDIRASLATRSDVFSTDGHIPVFVASDYSTEEMLDHLPTLTKAITPSWRRA